jgi:hypothetical protein
MAKLSSVIVRCRACGAKSPNFAEQERDVVPEMLIAAGWRWTANNAVMFGGYWLCAACDATPVESAALVGLRE